MSKFTDLHLELEIKAKDFRENPTDENGDKIIAEIVHLIENNASILVDGIPSDVNPNVMVYLIQTAGYHDILVPECFNKTFILGGWSQHIPEFAAKMSEIFK